MTIKVTIPEFKLFTFKRRLRLGEIPSSSAFFFPSPRFVPMRLFADSKSTKLQRKLQQEEQLLFAQEQARKRAQIEQDEKLAKELQAQESRPSRDSSTGSASPPPLPARPPKPLAYHPGKIKTRPCFT
jgi:hypothetical protein